MRNKIVILAILWMGLSHSAKCQLTSGMVYDTNLEIGSEDKEGKPLQAQTNLCFIYLNINTGDLMFKTDISTFESEDNYLDSILKKVTSQTIVFKSNISENLSRFTRDENDQKMYDMKGVLTINGVDILCVAQFTPMSFGDKNDPKNYRIDLRLYIDANKINIKGLENIFFNQVLFQIARARLNIGNITN